MFLRRQARTWHWMSGAICLIGMVLFSLTGITLNHAHQIEGQAVTSEQTLQLPGPIARILAQGEKSGELPAAAVTHIEGMLPVSLAGRPVEWSDVDAYVGLPRPGGDAWLAIDFLSGEVLYSFTDRGWIAYLNDLHKARHTGAGWRWFIDLFAVASILFSLTGLWLLTISAGRRSSTWPLVAGGLIGPVLLLLVFSH